MAPCNQLNACLAARLLPPFKLTDAIVEQAL